MHPLKTTIIYSSFIKLKIVILTPQKFKTMIQRIQSIYLFIAASAILFMHLLPLAQFGNYSVYACHIKNPGNENELISMLILAFLPVLSALLSLIALFKFKNRKLQMKLGWFNILLLIAIIAIEVIYIAKIGTILQIKASLGFAAVMPVVALLCVFFANRAIKKDDDLVKSADRIR
jgi:hypothetical protein